ncbi:MAG: UMP kinase [Mycoplasma sp.]
MERILIKISGESIGNNGVSILNADKVKELANELKEITKTHSVSIVVGAGNIWRGAKDSGLNIPRTISDNLGMVGTVINATTLAETLKEIGIDTRVYSPLKVGTLTFDIDHSEINQFLNAGKNIVIFAGGTGNPFFTTDSGAALRAAEIGAKWILMGKNGVDGVYSDDPKTNPKAIRFENLKYSEILEKQLKVMDLTALTLCMENGIKIRVFNANSKNGFYDAINNKIKSTIIE